jgi:hypothetical protein
MTVSSIAAEAFFCAGWIAVGAAAAYSRYKKALECGDKARGVLLDGATREYHRGLYFGRSTISVEAGPLREAQAPEAAGTVPLYPVELAPMSLVSLAKAVEGAERKDKPQLETTVLQATSVSSGT